MTCHDPGSRNVAYHPASTVMDLRKREAVLRLAEHHLTVSEFSALLADMVNGVVDVRVYDDAIVLMRDYRR